MCGIIGYTGGKAAVEVLSDAMLRLEYRGYDSAGSPLWMAVMCIFSRTKAQLPG